MRVPSNSKHSVCRSYSLTVDDSNGEFVELLDTETNPYISSYITLERESTVT